jgi:hypothetical protein
MPSRPPETDGGDLTEKRWVARAFARSRSLQGECCSRDSDPAPVPRVTLPERLTMPSSPPFGPVAEAIGGIVAFRGTQKTPERRGSDAQAGGERRSGRHGCGRASPVTSPLIREPRTRTWSRPSEHSPPTPTDRMAWPAPSCAGPLLPSRRRPSTSRPRRWRRLRGATTNWNQLHQRSPQTSMSGDQLSTIDRQP